MTSLFIPAGSTTASFTITTVQDAIDETNETIVIDLASVDFATEATEQKVTITILDDDNPPTDVTLSKSTIPENAGANVVIGTVSGTDPDAGAILTYSLPVGLTDNSAFSLSGTSLRANSSFDFEQKSSYIVTVRVTDEGGFKIDKQLTISVTNVNEAPAGANRSHDILEDSIYTFTANSFGYSDPTDIPANAFGGVKINTLPSSGSLTLNDAAVVAGQFVSAASIGAGGLKYSPVLNANGTNYASFSFQVQDNGGTANGGVNLDPTANTVTFNVASVNDRRLYRFQRHLLATRRTRLLCWFLSELPRQISILRQQRILQQR